MNYWVTVSKSVSIANVTINQVHINTPVGHIIYLWGYIRYLMRSGAIRYNQIVTVLKLHLYISFNIFMSNSYNSYNPQFRCCGYSEARDFKEFFKPSSCCDVEKNNTEDFKKCINPPTDQEGNLGEPPKYYQQVN